MESWSSNVVIVGSFLFLFDFECLYCFFHVEVIWILNHINIWSEVIRLDLTWRHDLSTSTNIYVDITYKILFIYLFFLVILVFLHLVLVFLIIVIWFTLVIELIYYVLKWLLGPLHSNVWREVNSFQCLIHIFTNEGLLYLLLCDLLTWLLSQILTYFASGWWVWYTFTSQWAFLYWSWKLWIIFKDDPVIRLIGCNSDSLLVWQCTVIIFIGKCIRHWLLHVGFCPSIFCIS